MCFTNANETATSYCFKNSWLNYNIICEISQAKNDAREAIDAKERHAEEMSELSEAVEMATLDKEMAEEKVHDCD